MMKNNTKIKSTEEMGARLLKIRTDLGYSQEAMASELDASRSSVVRWEAGQTDCISVSTLKSYAKLSKQSLDYIVYGEEHKFSSDDRLDEVLNRMIKYEMIMTKILEYFKWLKNSTN